MAAKKKVTKKAPARKAAKKATRKSTAKKAAKKSRAKKAAGKRSPAKKAAAKKSPAKKAAGKAPARKATKKTAKKSPARKAAKKTLGKQAGKTAGSAAKKTAARTAQKSRASGKKGTLAGAPVNTASVDDLPKKAASGKKAPKRGKMTAFVVKQRQKLLDLRDELMDAMYGVQHDTLRKSPEGSEASGSGMHQGDAGSDAYDRDFALNLLSKEQDSLHEIEAALERIEKGLYGVCEMSGKRIPQARLEAIPFARLTVECQTQWEKDFPQRQFRSEDALFYLREANNGAAVSLDDAPE